MLGMVNREEKEEEGIGTGEGGELAFLGLSAFDIDRFPFRSLYNVDEKSLNYFSKTSFSPKKLEPRMKYRE